MTECESLAKSICDRGLAVPAIFFLELYKPLTGICSAGVTILSPVFNILFGKIVTDKASEFFQSRDNIEDLMTKIEELSKE